MLYKLFTIILCIVILLLVSIMLTNNNIIFMKNELSKPKKNQYKEMQPYEYTTLDISHEPKLYLYRSYIIKVVVKIHLQS